MEKPSRRPVTDKWEAKRLEELQGALVMLLDDLTETFAWTALLCDGLSGLMTEPTSDIDPETQTGMRFAAIWLKRRNHEHAAHLQAACVILREIRERQGRARRKMPSSHKLLDQKKSFPVVKNQSSQSNITLRRAGSAHPPRNAG